MGILNDNVVRRIDPAGIITTFAGTGISGYSGDGGPALLAQLTLPDRISIDNLGNIYIVDLIHYVIRKITNCPTALITQQPLDASLCNAGNATFTITATNLIAYRWQEKATTVWNNISNNAMYAGATTNTLNIAAVTTAMNNYQYRCVLTNACGNGFTSTATLTVTTPAAPTININTTANSIYQGTLTTFTAIPTNGGTTPTYQWKMNGINVGTNTNTYSNNALLNADVISCVLVSNASCLSTTTANSNNITMTVNAPVAATISINASTNNICSGTMVNFIATATNGGATPTYQWKKNAINVGTNSASYSDNTLNNGDIISCVLTSNQTCLISNTATSNNVTMIVNLLLTPTITINASTNNVCVGTAITFNTTTTNSGTTPIYQWKKNGINVGTNSVTYTVNTLTSADYISCSVSISGGCFTTSSVSSNTIQSTILQPALPTVTINTSKTSVCKGSTINFSSVVTNATATTNYQWKKNGINVGTNSFIYTDNNIANGDAVLLNITTTTNNNCIAVTTVVSNVIAITVFENPIVTLDHTNTICDGGNKPLDAGNFASYQWSDGSIGRVLNITNLGTYYVTVKDNNGCIGSDTTKVTTLLPKPSNFLPLDTSICTYGSIVIIANSGYKNYLWNDFSAQPTLTVTQSGLYELTVTDNNNCKGKEDILLSKKDGCVKGFYIPTAFTPNGDNKNDFFKPNIFGNLQKYRFIIYNRYGQTLFESADINKGWDGKLQGQIGNTSGYVWFCNYQLEGEVEIVKKGTFVLVR